jgi:hypothetical protein
VGFDCVSGKCDDSATKHFTPLNNPAASSNWTYGFQGTEGGSFTPYASHWKSTISGPGALAIDFWSQASDSTEPSIFRNEAVTVTNYNGMALPPLSLDALPAGYMGQTSTLRWKAPESGMYTIAATFTGISFNGSTPATQATVGVLINNIVGPQSTSTLNKFTGGNAFTYGPNTVSLVAGDAVDFFVVNQFVVDDDAGGVQIEAHVTAP